MKPQIARMLVRIHPFNVKRILCYVNDSLEKKNLGASPASHRRMSNYAAATSKAQTRCTAAGAAAGALGHGAFASASSSCGSAADGYAASSSSCSGSFGCAGASFAQGQPHAAHAPGQPWPHQAPHPPFAPAPPQPFPYQAAQPQQHAPQVCSSPTPHMLHAIYGPVGT